MSVLTYVYLNFPQFLRPNSGVCLKLGLHNFRLHPFICLFINYSTILRYVVRATDSFIEQKTSK
jgi:hypothetical protein